MALDQPPGCGQTDTTFNTGSFGEKEFTDCGLLSCHVQVPRACFLFQEFFPRLRLLPTYPEIYRRSIYRDSLPNLWLEVSPILSSSIHLISNLICWLYIYSNIFIQYNLHTYTHRIYMHTYMECMHRCLTHLLPNQMGLRTHLWMGHTLWNTVVLKVN